MQPTYRRIQIRGLWSNNNNNNIYMNCTNPETGATDKIRASVFMIIFVIIFIMEARKCNTNIIENVVIGPRG